jgi:hypothetical protein
MRTHGITRALRATLTAALLAGVTWNHPAPAQSARAGRARAAATAVPRNPAAPPEPFGWALLSLLVAGTAGAYAVDRVPDRRRLAGWKRDGRGWLLRLLGKLTVGSVAAALLFAVNPVEAGWWRTVGTALLGGIGGEALLLASVATHVAHEAEAARDAARLETRRIAKAGARRIEELRALAVRLHRRGTRVRVGLAAAEGMEGGRGVGPPSRASPFELVINSVAEHGTAELIDEEDT